MGHYDDQYADSKENSAKQERRNIKKEFNKNIESLADESSIENMKFLNMILKDIDTWKAHAKFIGKF
jgi:hypothetical protein